MTAGGRWQQRFSTPAAEAREGPALGHGERVGQRIWAAHNLCLASIRWASMLRVARWGWRFLRWLASALLLKIRGLEFRTGRTELQSVEIPPAYPGAHQMWCLFWRLERAPRLVHPSGGGAGRAANLSQPALAISDARRLHRVAAELPEGRCVEAKALICRAPNPYLLRNGARALPLEELGRDRGLP